MGVGRGGGKPVSAGIFGVDPSGGGIVRVSPLLSARKVEVLAGGVRRDVYARHPWVAQSLFKAFSRAKAEVERALADNDMLTCMLPWSSYDLEVTRRLMGQDFWAYGVEPNRKILEAMCQYAHEQGLTPRRVGVEELFAPNTAEAWRQ